MSVGTSAVFERCRQALGTTQAELGKLLGVSERTAQRWTAQGTPSVYLPDLARVVHPQDPTLAREIATALGTTLEALGITVSPPPAATAPTPAPPPPPADGVVDAIVCAAAEAMDLKAHEVRAGLLAAFARAKEIGVSIDFVERVLRSALHPAPPVPIEPRAPASRSVSSGRRTR